MTTEWSRQRYRIECLRLALAQVPGGGLDDRVYHRALAYAQRIYKDCTGEDWNTALPLQDSDVSRET